MMEGFGWKYSAFISYRHDPDEKMAREIQNEIERYSVPKKWRFTELVEGNNLKKVFRDSTEFAGENDLTNAIRNALDGSAFLIVLVSEKTKLSPWVPQEIAYFLEHHDRSRIITVLTDGDNPMECYPEILLRKMLPDGRYISIEPLAVDYRGFEHRGNTSAETLAGGYNHGGLTGKPRTRKQIKKSELPRIIAPMLGIGYDDIVQRHRAYVRRRNTIISASAFALISIAFVYVIWSNIQIKKNLEESLIKQSLILAEESENAFREGDRVAALEYAVEALPDEKREAHLEMPVTPEAEYALCNALDAYVVPGNLQHAVPIRKMVMPGGINKMVISESNKYILGVGTNTGIGILDVENNVYKDYSRNSYSTVENVVEYKDRFFMMEELGDKLIISRFDILSEKDLITIDTNDYEDYTNVDDITIKNGYIIVPILRTSFFPEKKSVADFLMIDPETGEIVETKEVDFGDGYSRIYTIQTKDERYAAFAIQKETESISLFHSPKDIYLFNVEKRDGTIVEVNYENINGLEIIDDYIYISGQKVSDEFDLNDMTGVTGLDERMSLYSVGREIDIGKYDMQGNEQWSNTVGIDTFVGNTFITKYEQKDMKYIALAVSDELAFLDPNDGTKASEFRFPAKILDENLNGQNEVLLANGELGWVWYNSITGENQKYRSDNDINFEKLIEGEIREDEATRRKLVFFRNSDKDVVVYEQKFGDKTFSPLIDTTTGNAMNDEVLAADLVIGNKVISEGFNDNKYNVYCIDIENDKLLWAVNGDDLDGLDEFSVLGKGEDGIYILASDDDYHWHVLKLDPETGNMIDKKSLVEMFELESDSGFFNASNNQMMIYNNENIYAAFSENIKSEEFGASSKKSILIKCYNTLTGELYTKEICEVEGTVTLDSIYMDEESRCVLLKYVDRTDEEFIQRNRFALYNIEDETVTALDEMTVEDFVSSINYSVDFFNDGFYISAPDAVRKYDYSGNLIYEIPTGGQMSGGLTVHNSKLYIVWDSSEVKIYSADKGEQEDSFSFDNKTLYAYDSDWFFNGDELIMINYSKNYYSSGYIIDMKEKKVRASIQGVSYYSEDLEKFLVGYSDMTGTFRRHTLEDMLDMAAEELE